ncbi:translation initiation factor IF-2, chloroplastic [Tanacetum coccineum]
MLLDHQYQVIGLNNVPFAGDEFEVVDSLDIARARAEERAISVREERILAKSGDGRITLSSFASAVTTGKNSRLDLHQLNIILKKRSKQEDCGIDADWIRCSFIKVSVSGAIQKEKEVMDNI